MTTGTRLARIDAEAMRIAAAGVVDLPVEQSARWEDFERSQGRACWGRFEWYEGDRRCAVIALYEVKLRNIRFLWARWGPVWLKEATPDREAAFRKDLVDLVKAEDSGIVFVRMHATYSAPDLHVPIQTVAYDRTVVIDTSGRTEESVTNSMTKEGRRTVRRGRKKADEAGATLAEEAITSAQEFAEHYQVLVETAERDGFRPHPINVYVDLLTTLGPKSARVFTMRDANGTLLCWDIILVSDRRAQAEYGASTAAGRRMAAPAVLDHWVAVQLAGEGITGLDLMGAHSPRTPELFHVGKYKRDFASGYTDVPGMWEVATKPTTYKLLRTVAEVRRKARKRS